MSIFTNRIIQEAYQKVYQKKLIESRQFIYESAIDKNIHRADKLADDIAHQFAGSNYGEIVRDENGEIQRYVRSGREMRYNAEFIKHNVGEMISHSKDVKAKFFLGCTRILGELMEKYRTNTEQIHHDCSEFNKILGIITGDDNHINEYDNNLNGKTLNELKELFGQTVKDVSDKRKEALNSKNYNKNERYTIIPCNEWEDLLPYGSPLTTWCVAQTYGKDAYNSYTSNGLNKFYVCLRDDYKTVEKKVGQNAPLDDYGLSMIAINVDALGELNTCTVRWNHSYGGNDNAMTVEQISDLLGVNFYETFAPKDPRETFEKLIYDERDPICSKLGFRKDDDSDFDYYNLEDDKLMHYMKCYEDNSRACFANKYLVWFDMKSGNKIDPPERIDGNFDCYQCGNLSSLKGSPREVGGSFDCSQCNNLTSLEGSPRDVGGCFECQGCYRLSSLKGAPEKIGGWFNCSDCNNLTSLEGAPKEVSGNFLCNSCLNITSLNGAPRKVGGDFYCYRCENLASLEGAPEKVGGEFDCHSCNKLTSLEGAPREVGGNFCCYSCDKRIALEGIPEYIDIDGKFYC